MVDIKSVKNSLTFLLFKLDTPIRKALDMGSLDFVFVNVCSPYS